MINDERANSPFAEERMLSLVNVKPSLINQIEMGYFNDGKKLMAYLVFKKCYQDFSSLHKSFIIETYEQWYDNLLKELRDYNGSIGAGTLDDVLRYVKGAESYKELPQDEFDSTFIATEEILRRLYGNRKTAESFMEAAHAVASGEKTPIEAYAKIGEKLINPKVIPKNFYDHLEEAKDKDNSEPIYCGNVEVDRNTGGYRRGNIILWSGDTGSMKTISAMWHIRDILKTNPTFKAVIFQKEMPIVDMLLRELSHISQTSDGMLHDRRLEEAVTQAEEEVEFRKLYERMYFVAYDQFDSVSDMWAYITAIKPDVWMIDFIQLLGTANDGNVVYEDLAKQIKHMTMQTNTLGIVISQLKANSIESRPIKVPQLDDVIWINVLKFLTSYAYMTFKPAKYYPGAVPDEYYYLVNRKNRFNPEFFVPFIARAETKDFLQPIGGDCARWYTDYTVKKFKQKI